MEVLTGGSLLKASSSDADQLNTRDTATWRMRIFRLSPEHCRLSLSRTYGRLPEYFDALFGAGVEHRREFSRIEPSLQRQVVPTVSSIVELSIGCQASQQLDILQSFGFKLRQI